MTTRGMKAKTLLCCLLFVFCLQFTSSFLLDTMWDTQDPPQDWKQRIAEGHMLFSPSDPSDSWRMPEVGNGYVATVVLSTTQYIAGVYNGAALSAHPSHRARIPATSAISITGSVELIGMALDMEKGVFYRRSMVEGDACSLAVEQRWYAHRVHRNLLCHEITVHPHCSDPTAQWNLQLTSQTGPNSQDIAFSIVNQTDSLKVVSGSIMQKEEVNSLKVQVAYATTTVPNSVSGKGSARVTFPFITAFMTNLETQNPVNDAVALYKTAYATASELLSTHENAWKSIWQGRIEIAGDLELAQAVNSSTYYILSSVRNDWHWGVSPGGLASNGYNGHMFWDQETWMYPTMALFYPEMARSMLEYRYQHMEGAKLKAESYQKGYKGLMYPWESAFSGQEVCPTTAPTGKLEQHISGDIAFAIEQYWRTSMDLQWLRSKGFPMLKGIAEFWASRVVEKGGEYVIDGVIPPDEYAVNVNNSVYTNVVAKYSLDIATKAGAILQESVPSEWTTISQLMKIPFDSSKGIHPEYDGYNGQLTKQADVVLLRYPLMYPMPAGVASNDLDYYSQRTDPNGPAMTWSMFATGLLEEKKFAQAADTFKKSYANIKTPFNVWTETPTGGTVNFITGAGGFLQGVWAGYGGMRLRESQLDISPVLPDSVSSVKYTGLHYMQNNIDIQHNATQMVFTLTKASTAFPLMVKTLEGKAFALSEKPLTLQLGQVSLYSTQ